MRGVNRQCIFEDEEDCIKFAQVLEQYKDRCRYELYAYCLMENHVHLLLKVGEEPLVQVMRRICGSYVYWYNWKYDRVGNLFQDRFKSETVEDDTYFLTVLRYMHQNPIKANLVKAMKKYMWSSYGEYIGETIRKIDGYWQGDCFESIGCQQPRPLSMLYKGIIVVYYIAITIIIILGK